MKEAKIELVAKANLKNLENLHHIFIFLYYNE